MKKISESFSMLFLGSLLFGGFGYYFFNEIGLKVGVGLSVFFLISTLFSRDDPDVKSLSTGNSSSGADQTDYVSFVPDLLSLCVAAGGKRDKNIINLAIAFIENDDLMTDKKSAINSFSTNVDLLVRSGESYLAVFKLKSTAVIRSAKGITDEFHIERINIMLDGVIDMYKENDAIEKTQYIKDSINKNFEKGKEYNRSHESGL